MIFYLIILLILIGLLAGLIVWINHIFRLFQKGNIKSFVIQGSILTILVIFVTWELQIFPLSKNFYIKKRAAELTGKSFWSWKEYDYEDFSVRGEGYNLDIYQFDEEIADYFKDPDSTFFNHFPPDDLADIKWIKTPVKEQEILEFVTPIYGGWSGEIVDRQEFIKKIANNPGAYYSYRNGGSTDFYLISPDKRLVIMIYHNM